MIQPNHQPPDLRQHAAKFLAEANTVFHQYPGLLTDPEKRAVGAELEKLRSANQPEEIKAAVASVRVCLKLLVGKGANPQHINPLLGASVSQSSSGSYPAITPSTSMPIAPGYPTFSPIGQTLQSPPTAARPKSHSSGDMIAPIGLESAVIKPIKAKPQPSQIAPPPQTRQDPPPARATVADDLPSLLLSMGSDTGATFSGSEMVQLKKPSDEANRRELMKKNLKVIAVLGEGANGVVYLAENIDFRAEGSMGRLEAVKVILKRPKNDEKKRKDEKAHYREAALARNMKEEEGLTPVLGVGEINSCPYLTMPYLGEIDDKGQVVEEVHDLTKISPDLKLITRLVLCEKMAKSIQALHRKHKLISLDIKLANFLVRSLKDGDLNTMRENIRVFGSDFGLAYAFDPKVGHIDTKGMIKGTPKYMSREQALGDKLTPATDVHSLGITMVEVLTGSVPYKDDRREVMNLIMSDVRNLQSSPIKNEYLQALKDREVPKEVIDLLIEMTDVNPADRPDMSKVVSVFTEYLNKKDPNFIRAKKKERQMAENAERVKAKERKMKIGLMAGLPALAIAALIAIPTIQKKGKHDTFERAHAQAMANADAQLSGKKWTEALAVINGEIKAVTESGDIDESERSQKLSDLTSRAETAKTEIEKLKMAAEARRVAAERAAALARETTERNTRADTLIHEGDALMAHTPPDFDGAIAKYHLAATTSPERKTAAETKERTALEAKCVASYQAGLRAYHWGDVGLGLRELGIVQGLQRDGIQMAAGIETTPVATLLDRLTGWVERRDALENEVLQALGWSWVGLGEEKTISIPETVENPTYWRTRFDSWYEEAKKGDSSGAMKILLMHMRMIEQLNKLGQPTGDRNNQRQSREGARYRSISSTLPGWTHILVERAAEYPGGVRDTEVRLASLIGEARESIDLVDSPRAGSPEARLTPEQRMDKQKVYVVELYTCCYEIIRLIRQNDSANLTFIEAALDRARQCWRLFDTKLGQNDPTRLDRYRAELLSIPGIRESQDFSWLKE